MLEEIFKSKPELLQEKEVQDLIEFSKASYKRNMDILLRYKEFHDDVFQVCINSELFNKDGFSHKMALESIYKLIEDAS
jgi:hypothetical protein